VEQFGEAPADGDETTLKNLVSLKDYCCSPNQHRFIATDPLADHSKM
jgi:hypothetical protein